MKYIQVDSINMNDLKIYHQLRDTVFRSDGSFIADSPKVVNMLLQTEIEVKSILATQEYYNEFETLISLKNIPNLYLASKGEMEKIIGHKIHHNCMMHGKRPAQTELKSLGNEIIMLDEITSSENVGSIARSAVALGVDSYLLSNKSPHPFNRRALRVSMGHASLLKTHIYSDIVETIGELKAMGYKILAAEVRVNSTALSKVKSTEKWVLIMGHEGKGISQEILNLCDEVITIEMKEGIKSFNVAVAASIMMYKLKFIV